MGIESAIERLDCSNDFSIATPSDSTVLVGVRGLVIGGAGDLVVTTKADVEVTIPVIAGQILPISPKTIKAATTATDILILK